MDVQTLAAKLEAGESLFLLDVREPNENDLCQIKGSTLIPMGQVPNRLAEIPKDIPIVIHCHHGGRSQRVAQYLESQGFNQLSNLVGGIDQWAVHINPEITRY